MTTNIIKSPEYKIRKIREIRNYSQEYLAQSLNLSVRAYSKIETGETQLTIRRLNEISQILEVTPLQILGFDEKQLFSKQAYNMEENQALHAVNEAPAVYLQRRILQMEQELAQMKNKLREVG
jgi:transcriptional regulator with XRE-family HTH domain